MTTGMSTPPIVMARVTPITPDRVVPNMAKPTLKLDSTKEQPHGFNIGSKKTSIEGVTARQQERVGVQVAI